jgi:starch synthase
MVIISRLTEQKGLDLVLWILGELMSQDVQLAVLGVGDQKYEDSLRSMAAYMPKKVSLSLTFSEPLSHKFYASADMILVPSLFEPCGLTQMIAMRYGTLPVVRETGGLKDSVIPYNKLTGEGNGFSFANYNAHELLFTLKDAINLYYDNPEAWNKLVENAVNSNFSWSTSAEKYAKLYGELLGIGE